MRHAGRHNALTSSALVWLQVKTQRIRSGQTWSAFLYYVAVLILLGVSTSGCVSGDSAKEDSTGAQALLEGMEVKLCGRFFKEWCFYDETGKRVYWVEDDRFGSVQIEELQKEYNRWIWRHANRPNSRAELFPSHYTSQKRGWALNRYRSVWKDGRLHMVNAEYFIVPDRISASGVVDFDTLMIPFFKSGVQITELWQNFLDDCMVQAKTPGTYSEADCQELSLGELARAVESLQAGRVSAFWKEFQTDDVLFQYRAIELGQAVSSSVTLQQKFLDERERLGLEPYTFRVEKLRKNFLNEIRTLDMEIATHVVAAEQAERAYRALRKKIMTP